MPNKTDEGGGWRVEGENHKEDLQRPLHLSPFTLHQSWSLRLLYEIALIGMGLWYLPYAFATRRITYSLGQRLGDHPNGVQEKLRSPEALWVHAVSVGEIQAAQPLIVALRKRCQAPFVISAVTETGYRTAQQLAHASDVVVHLPFDLKRCVGRAFGQARPRLCLILETELWPNFWQLWLDKQVPIVIVNGRISDRAWPRYRWVRSWIKPWLAQVHACCVQTERDAERFRQLGVPPDRIHVTGNLKFDLTIDEQEVAQQAQGLRRAFGLRPEDQVLVAGSTHPGEEEMLLEMYQRLRRQFPRLRLVLAPRHPQRTKEVTSLVRRFGYEPLLRTGVRPSTSVAPWRGSDPSPVEVMILDTIGELVACYSLATIVFVGGSLTRHGGHNPIEPAFFAKPILTGPHLFNFQAVFDQFFAHEACQLVHSPAELITTCETLLRDPVQSDALGRRAQQLILAAQGTAHRVLTHLDPLLRASGVRASGGP